MYLEDKLKGNLGKLQIKIEGFFVERFVNLAKANEIELWEIKQKDAISITAYLKLRDFKRIKKIAKKTKCKVKILKKEGCYFLAHRYRKRKPLLVSAIIVAICIMYMSNLVFNIKIEGNNINTKKEITKILNDNNIKLLKNKKKINTKKVSNLLRLNLKNVTFASVDIKGVNIVVRIVEGYKNIDKENLDKPSNIICKKSGKITKIIAESGTRVLNQDMKAEKGQIAICGILESKFLSPKLVKSKGILRANVDYSDKTSICLNQNIIKYTGKKRIFLGFYINNKEIILNYLRKSQKYDITKCEKTFNLFNIQFKFNVYTAREFENKNFTITEKKAKEILDERIDAIIKSRMRTDETLVFKDICYKLNDNYIIANFKYTLDENIAEEVNLEIGEMEE